MSRLPAQIHKSRGFTLLEAVVAMTLLAFGIVGALAAITACVHTVAGATEYSRAALLAQQVTAQLERGTTLTAGNQSGTFDNLDAHAENAQLATGTQATSMDCLMTHYTWSATIGAMDTLGNYPVTITIQWPSNRQYQMSTMLRPQALQTKPSTTTGTGGTAGTGGSGGTGGTGSAGASGSVGTGSGGGTSTPRPGGTS